MTTIPLVSQPSDPYPVLVSFAERAKQRRWTVLLRIFMAIPLLVVVVVFGIANTIVVIIGWFGALFMGRTPKFVRDLTTITMRLSLRLSAYGLLLNDRFPSFALEGNDDDLVRLAIPEATRMNRWAVFFRIILVIPVSILSSVVQWGSAPFVVFGWFAALITGWLPAPIYELNRMVIRFEIRVSAYSLLLVPTYPGKLFGDPVPLVDTPVDAPPLAPPVPAPTWAPPGGEPMAVAPAEAPQPGMHPSWALVLGRGGRRLMVIAIIIGVPAYVTSVALRVSNAIADNSDEHLISANNTLVGQIAQFGSRGQACGSASNSIECYEANDGRLAGQLTTFANTLADNPDNDISHLVVSNARSAATHLASLLRTVSEAGNNQQAFKNAANVGDINQAANNVRITLNALQTALNNR